MHNVRCVILLSIFSNAYSDYTILRDKCSESWPDCVKNKKKELDPNVVCKYATCDVRAVNCEEILLGGKMRQTLLHAFNSRRNAIALGKDKNYTDRGVGPIADMMVLSYALDLEYQALCQANGCNTLDSGCHATAKYPQVGLLFSYFYCNTDVQISAAELEFNVNLLFNGVKYLPSLANLINKYEESTVNKADHITQLIWAKTNRIGCGISKSQFRLYLSCTFAPKGNVVGEKIYQRGNFSTECPDRRPNPVYKGLCGDIDTNDLIEGINPWRSKELNGTCINQPCLCNILCIFISIIALNLLY